MTADRRRLLNLLGLGLRSRGAVAGVEQVRLAARKGKLFFAVVAHDASQHSLDKVVPLLTARRIPFTQDLSVDELGSLTGKPATAAIGVTDRNLAQGLRTSAQARPGSEGGPNQAQ